MYTFIYIYIYIYTYLYIYIFIYKHWAHWAAQYPAIPPPTGLTPNTSAYARSDAPPLVYVGVGGAI